VEKPKLNERLRRGGRKRRLGLEAPNYLVVGIRESVLRDGTKPGIIVALAFGSAFFWLSMSFSGVFVVRIFTEILNFKLF